MLVRLNNGRVLKGTVQDQHASGVNILPVGGIGKGLAESVLAREIVGWVPAGTPRGKDTYRKWLQELLPVQMKNAAVAWNMYLAAREVGLNIMADSKRIVLPENRLPDVRYQILEERAGLVFQARPIESDLGSGWEMDESRNVRSIGTSQPLKGESEF